MKKWKQWQQIWKKENDCYFGMNEDMDYRELILLSKGKRIKGSCTSVDELQAKRCWGPEIRKSFESCKATWIYYGMENVWLLPAWFQINPADFTTDLAFAVSTHRQ